MSVTYCNRCLYPSNHPLGLIIDEQGICSGCRIHEEKDTIDWDHRLNEIKSLTTDYKSKSGANYDCVIPVTGAGDSFYIVHLAKNVLGLNPLLVHYNKYYNTSVGIKNLSQLRTVFDCDILFKHVNPHTVKKIIRSTLRLLGSFHWPAIAGHTVFPVQVAVQFRIPLIIWGAHQGLEQVGMFSHLHNVEMTRRYRKDHDLMGYEADDLLSNYDNLTESDIWQYRYPEFDSINSIGVRGIYLGNFFRWDPLVQHLQMVKQYGYTPAQQQRTFDTFDHIDDWHYMDLHDFIKQQKCGISKVTDHASREIRFNRLSRSDASSLVHYYQQCSPKFVRMFQEWVGLPDSALNFILRQHSALNHQSIDPSNFEAFDIISQSLKDVGFDAERSLSEINPCYITYGKGLHL